MGLLSSDMIQALGVIVGLVVVAVLVIKASSSQSAYATRSMETVVNVMAGGLRDDMRETQTRIHEDLRSYQSQQNATQNATRDRIERVDDRLTEIGASVNQVRRDHGDRLSVVERIVSPPQSLPRDLDA